MFYIRPESGEPIYYQRIRQIKHAATCGIIHSGDQMPAVREWAAQRVINPNTGARAYRELVQEGVLTATQSGGAFVIMEPLPPIGMERERRLELPEIAVYASYRPLIGFLLHDLSISG